MEIEPDRDIAYIMPPTYTKEKTLVYLAGRQKSSNTQTKYKQSYTTLSTNLNSSTDKETQPIKRKDNPLYLVHNGFTSKIIKFNTRSPCELLIYCSELIQCCSITMKK